MAIKKSKKNLKIIGATSMALFSLVSVFVATIAWFALNNSVGASGMAIKAHASGPAFSSITVHRCILSECNTDQYVFSTTPEVTGTTSGAGSGASGLSGEYSVAMDQYTDLGPSQPILLLFTLPDETMVDNNILLDGICTYTGSSANYIASLSSMDTSNTQKLSSIVSFYGRASADSSTYFTYSDSSGKIVFSRNSTYLNTSSFVTKDTIDDVDNYTFNKEIVLYSGADIDKGEEETSYIKYVAIVMDYNQDIINYIYGNGNTGEIHYAIDWTMVMR